jgi:SAM-dependent methyltransferase
MKKRLVDYLACPECKGSLRCIVYQEDSDFPWTEIIEGCLTCNTCCQEYAISRGVPRLLPSTRLADEVKNTVDGFGYEWATFNDQIQDSYMTGKNNFLDFVYPVTEQFFEDKFVLDAGCGMGRFTRLAAEFGSRDAIGIDLSQSVDAAYRNTRYLSNAHVVQADIMALPFQTKFNYIFSLGVLQFLANPREGFHQLCGQLAENGRISIWVYSEEGNGWIIRFIDPFRKFVTSSLPRPVLYQFSRLLGTFLFAILKLIYRPANEGVLGVKFGKFLPFNDYLYYTSRLNYSSVSSVIFDHLVPQLVVYLPREDVESWFADEQLKEVILTSRNNMSWRAVGTRV